MGSGRSPGGGSGGEAPGSKWVLHIYRVVFYVKNDPLFDYYSMILHAKKKKKNTKKKKKNTKKKSNTITFQYTQIEMEFRGFLSKSEVMVGVFGRSPRKLMEFMHLQCSSTLKMTRCST